MSRSADHFEVSGNLVDLAAGQIVPATVTVAAGRIAGVEPFDGAASQWLVPGLVDAHVHVESSLLVPSEFARAAVAHGTVATVSDPHEIANVLGTAGVEFMLENAANVPFKFLFGAPSCVPATRFETAGAELSSADVAALLDDPRIGYLSEVMNYPAVIAGDDEVCAKLEAAKRRGKPIDGHAPGLRGDDARRYIAAGITTDHECFTLDEAEEKHSYGAKIQIREGSAARNFAALFPLVDRYPADVMFASDDKHPDALVKGHIDELVRRSLAQGADLMNVLRCASANPVDHYGLDVGQLRVGDPADFLVLDDLQSFRVAQTYIDGRLVAEAGEPLIERVPIAPINHFKRRRIVSGDLRLPARGSRVQAIVVRDGELITGRKVVDATIVDGAAVADPNRDLLKLAVVNRYADTPVSLGFVRNMGLRRGAFASSVAHDSHNIIAAGTNDEDLCAAVNLVVDNQGGLAVAAGSELHALPLAVAGLMSTSPIEQVAAEYSRLDALVKQLGTTLAAPFMALSFLALLVIPDLKLSDLTLFDGSRFEPVALFVD